MNINLIIVLLFTIFLIFFTIKSINKLDQKIKIKNNLNQELLNELALDKK